MALTEGPRATESDLSVESDLAVVTVETDDLPGALAAAAVRFNLASRAERVQLLLEYSRNLPAPPPELRDCTEFFERVEECQDPVYLRAVVTDSRVRIHALVGPDAPTLRGMASIMIHALDGLTVDEVLAVPADACLRMGLQEVVGAFRMRGSTGMLTRLKRQVREQS